ncbi:protein FAR1-RELATED SEQUENCE 7-like [Silene latifolia]|uniref:protein FAR1-RELATED SEQUENCE 7-like n=1 Tax=Silene latifolia TaxID=37657 RepID=UPI003D76A87B
MTEALVRPSVQYRVLAAISGGEEFVRHTKRDHINYVNRLKMRAIEGGDASTLESMGEDVLPVTIFTDQDLAMKNAIKESVFNKCLNGCYSEAEFEDTWRKMISDYGLHDSDWFERLYTLREKWCTALNKEYFSAGILSSQRSESTNHALGFQATKTTSLPEFFHIFESTVKRWRLEEERNEFNNIRAKPTSVFPMVDLLDHAAQVYTLNLFRAFEKEFGIAIGTRAIECTTEDHIKSYLVYPSGSDENPHHVTFDSSNLLIDCTCRKFQESGMLCFHSIRILHLRSVSGIPDRYISRRWTKFAKKEV